MIQSNIFSEWRKKKAAFQNPFLLFLSLWVDKRKKKKEGLSESFLFFPPFLLVSHNRLFKKNFIPNLVIFCILRVRTVSNSWNFDFSLKFLWLFNYFKKCLIESEKAILHFYIYVFIYKYMCLKPLNVISLPRRRLKSLLCDYKDTWVSYFCVNSLIIPLS